MQLKILKKIAYTNMPRLESPAWSKWTVSWVETRTMQLGFELKPSTHIGPDVRYTNKSDRDYY
jgi:hypothetical protein